MTYRWTEKLKTRKTDNKRGEGMFLMIKSMIDPSAVVERGQNVRTKIKMMRTRTRRKSRRMRQRTRRKRRTRRRSRGMTRERRR